ncbi:MAG: trimethylamine methyltransferase family protein [bacterium]
MNGTRQGRRKSVAGQGIDQRPWSQPKLTLEPSRILSDDHIEAIHSKSLQVLQDIGMDILNPEAREILARAGALVSDLRVRIGQDIVEEALKTPPAEFTLHARNPDHSIRIGGKWIAFSPVGGPPNCADLDRGRRPGTLQDNGDFVRLSQFFNCIHSSGDGAVDALDRHASVRHLHVMRNKMLLSDKAPFVSSTSVHVLQDSLEIVRLARGITEAQMLREPSAYTVINTNSPLKLDNPMGMGVIEMARRGQMCVVTPFTLAGAMAPVTLAGALVEQNAEVLACLALSQLARPGAPFVYGSFTSNVDMRSGAPAFGTPEYMKACIAGGQMARRYGLPYRTSSANAANALDAQAAYETMFSLWAAIMAGGNLVIHSAGWMEGGLVASFEKFALDVELLQMVEAFLEPIIVDEDSMALDAMLEVGPGGHFFGAAHTMSRYSTAFHQPLISDWRNYHQWVEAGSPEAPEKANALWKKAVAEYREPPVEPRIACEIDAFVERRLAEGGQPTDF